MNPNYQAYSGEIRKLSRFTNLAILMDILKRLKFFMPKYNSWEDKNDTEVLDHYLHEMKQKHSVVELRALCFTHDDETNA